MRDYHIHTSLCKHAEGEMEQYVEAAIAKGITEICFTDHIPMPNNFDPEHRMDMDQMDVYIQQIDYCRSKYKKINILMGIEADYMEGCEEYLENFLSTYHFDMVIMSVHFIKKWGDKGWVFSYEYTKDTIKQQYKDYFDCVVKGAQTGLFDVMGHFDLIKRLNHPVLNTNAEDVHRALNAVRDNHMSLELNASGLRKFIKEPYPAAGILELAVQKDIPIVLASDAHKPEDVGYRFDDMFNLLFDYPGLQLAAYSKRQGRVDGIIAPDEAEPDLEDFE